MSDYPPSTYQLPFAVVRAVGFGGIATWYQHAARHNEPALTFFNLEVMLASVVQGHARKTCGATPGPLDPSNQSSLLGTPSRGFANDRLFLLPKLV